MAIFDRLLMVQSGEPASAALNMAIDEAILEWATFPVIRFYGWARPSVSFGCFGKLREVMDYEATHDIVRRWTGGGIVFHGNDLTYSLVLPFSADQRLRDSREIYRLVHEALRKTLNRFGIGAEIVTQRPLTTSKACFASPVLADVVAGDFKVAGAAHRRTKAGLLHQGSIQNFDLPRTLAQVFAQELSGQVEKITLPDSVTDRATVLSAAKYASPDWLERW